MTLEPWLIITLDELLNVTGRIVVTVINQLSGALSTTSRCIQSRQVKLYYDRLSVSQFVLVSGTTFLGEKRILRRCVVVVMQQPVVYMFVAKSFHNYTQSYHLWSSKNPFPRPENVYRSVGNSCLRWTYWITENVLNTEAIGFLVLT
jgi:hypothetical protein